jgi:rare lipoprotein A
MERPQLALLPVIFALAGCTMIGAPATVGPRPGAAGSATGSSSAAASIEDLVPRPEPPAARGNMQTYEQGGRTYRVLDWSYGYDERGLASWYGEDFQGRPTSSGEPFDMYKLSAAHKTLPIPTYVRVTNLANGQSVVLRVNDRGPFSKSENRLIDVSYAAAVRLGMVRTGTANVRVQALEPWQYRVGR